MTVQKHAPVVCLQTQALCLDLGKRTLLDALDWQVQAGQVWAVLGISGSGKSTLLRVLAGLPVPGQFSVRGQVSWGPQGCSTPSRKERARLLAWMSQSDFQPFACTVAQRVLAGRYPHGGLLGWETPADHASMNEALQAVGLEGFEQRQFQSLSGGEQRRASLAAALVQEPKLLLLDEPLSQLDWHHQTRLAGLFKPWALRNDAAVVWVTHDPNLALRYATHCLAFLPGGCSRQGPVQDFQNAGLLGEVYGCAVEAACPMRCFFPVS